MAVDLIRDGDELILKARYVAELPARWRALGGRFDKSQKQWVFRAAAEAEVLELLWEFYGWAPDHVPGERVTVYLELGPEHDAQEIRAGDRVLLSRNSPYSQPRIPSNVDLVEGQLPRRASHGKGEPRVFGRRHHGSVVIAVRNYDSKLMWLLPGRIVDPPAALFEN